MHFSARTVSGSGRGKSLHFPTINLDMSDVPEGIEDGLYACFVDAQTLAVLHFGIRPTFDDTPSCEVHIIDAHIATPPDTLDITIVQKIRETVQFDSPEELMQQIESDIVTARGMLSTS